MENILIKTCDLRVCVSSYSYCLNVRIISFRLRPGRYNSFLQEVQIFASEDFI